jgi:AraC-like DNA-binding protein
MEKSRKYLADKLIMSPNFNRRQLALSHPDAAPLRERDIMLSAICGIKDVCEVERKDPNVHILIFSIRGHARLYAVNCSRRGTQIEPGQVAILPAHFPHSYKMTGDFWEAIWFYLADTDLWHQLRTQKPHVRNSITLKELKAAFEGFLAESLRNETRARIAGRHYAELLLLNLERELGMEESQHSKQMRQRLYGLWDAVSANLSHKWTVQELADKLGISPQHLYKVSMRFSGRKPMEMVTQMRMHQAQELLTNTDNLVKSIAFLLGYSDSFSFSAAFKRYTGYSPREFRRHGGQKALQDSLKKKAALQKGAV